MHLSSPLKAGDTIGIAAPASPFDRARFMKGVHALERLGFKTFYRKDIFDQNRYFAGSDERRAQELIELFERREVHAIMFARGGYGSQRIIPLLDADRIAAHPKPVVGFSDLTALLAFLRQRCNLPTFYGPVVTQLGKAKSAITGESLQRALTTDGALGPMPMGQARVIREGHAQGPLVGGCLTLINSSIGTPYEPALDDAILFIEEVGEKVYVLDRMLTQLINSNRLGSVRGILFGSLLPPPEESCDVESMIRDVLRHFEGPVVAEFPAGHIDAFVTLPLGIETQLTAPDSAEPTLAFTQGSFS